MDSRGVTDCSHKPKEDIHQQLPIDELQVSPSRDASKGSEKKLPSEESKEAIALDMLQCYPELCIAALKESEGKALNPLARHSAFRNAIPHHSSFWPRRTFSFHFMKHMRQTKSDDEQARELLNCICKQISISPQQYRAVILCKPIYTAVSCGNVGFVAEVATNFPDILGVENVEYGRSLFSYAISERQEKIFCFLHKRGAMQLPLATMLDNEDNSILHQAAMLSPTLQASNIPNAALQMHRELQWFQEVEKIAPIYKEAVNNKGKTPRDLFTEEHKLLLREGEKWMKETATSCTVVATLIVTIMFAAAFTVPGGYDGYTGVPVYLQSDIFIIFITSDALSMFFSSISVLMFLGLHTSRYREGDFLIVLPANLAIGLDCLFLSIATMMIAFGSSIAIMLRERFVWIPLPIIMLASIPSFIFVVWQYPLFIQIVKLASGPGVDLSKQ